MLSAVGVTLTYSVNIEIASKQELLDTDQLFKITMARNTSAFYCKTMHTITEMLKTYAATLYAKCFPNQYVSQMSTQENLYKMLYNDFRALDPFHHAVLDYW